MNTHPAILTHANNMNIPWPPETRTQFADLYETFFQKFDAGADRALAFDIDQFVAMSDTARQRSQPSCVHLFPYGLEHGLRVSWIVSILLDSGWEWPQVRNGLFGKGGRGFLYEKLATPADVRALDDYLASVARDGAVRYRDWKRFVKPTPDTQGSEGRSVRRGLARFGYKMANDRWEII